MTPPISLPGVVPRTHLPAKPIRGSIEPDERILLLGFDRARETSLMDLLPALGDLRKHVVVAAADQVLIAQLVVGQPALAVDEIPHVAVEHRHRRGRVLHEKAHLVGASLDRLLGASAFGEVAADRLVFDDAATLVEETAVSPLVPAHLPAGPLHLVLDRRHRMIGRDRREKRPGRRMLILRDELPERLADELFR